MSLYCCLNYHVCKQFFKGGEEDCVCVYTLNVCPFNYFKEAFILKFSVFPRVTFAFVGCNSKCIPFPHFCKQLLCHCKGACMKNTSKIDILKNLWTLNHTESQRSHVLRVRGGLFWEVFED